jgi:hypothetical protein
MWLCVWAHALPFATMFGSEVRTLELLKIRFGESSLSTCEIMVGALVPRLPTDVL